ncbi:MAG: cytochrome c [Bryobacterales bacterium]|nr:cytochrome c [Bryobacterales bacterium]
MSKLSLAVFLVFAIQTLCAQSYGIGRPATEAEIESLDVTIGPEGRELPDGSGSVQEGAQVYEVRCKECHGESGAGGDHAALVGNPEQLKQAPPIKTVGSFWPYATTLFDYTRRAMPFEEPGTLTDDQIYAVTAYVLHINGIVDENATLDRESLPKVEMPNRGGFVRDPRSKP